MGHSIVQKIIKNHLVSGEMKSGAATIAPTEHDGDTACRFCAYAAVCRAADKRK